MLLNNGVGEDPWESPGQQRDQTSESWRKSTLNNYWKGWCWSWSSNTLAIWYEESTHWKRPWCWERLKSGEGDDRRRDGWMTSQIRWIWVWANSGRWWRTGKPGVLQSMSQRAGHFLVTEQQQNLGVTSPMLPACSKTAHCLGPRIWICLSFCRIAWP